MRGAQPSCLLGACALPPRPSGLSSKCHSGCLCLEHPFPPIKILARLGVALSSVCLAGLRPRLPSPASKEGKENPEQTLKAQLVFYLPHEVLA